MPWDNLHDLKTPGLDTEKGLRAIAECQFTLAGFVRPEDLPLCKKLGLMAIIGPKNSNVIPKGDWLKMS